MGCQVAGLVDSVLAVKIQTANSLELLNWVLLLGRSCFVVSGVSGILRLCFEPLVPLRYLLRCTISISVLPVSESVVQTQSQVT